MKKNYLAMAALAFGLLGFSACSSDDALDDSQSTVTTGEMQDVELTFNIGVNSGKETRAGRPLYSAEALQRVNKMNVYYFKEDNGQYKYAGEVASTNNFGFQLSADQGTMTTENTLSETLEEGANYKFLAIGLEDNGSAYNDFKAQLTENTTVLEDVKLTLGAGAADEAFAGVSEVITITDGKASKNPIKIQLNRVVAGVLGYFKNVPYKVNYSNEGLVQVTKVVVKAIQKGTDVKYVDNGTTVANVWAAGTQNNTAYDLITIDLKGCTEVEGQNIYSNASYSYGSNNVEVEENSFVGGQFVLPVASIASKNTLVVELRGTVSGEEKVLKTFQVKKGGEIAYTLDANSFYSIGHKSTTDGTNGEDGNDDGDEEKDPDDPNKDDDPVDLSKDTYIELTVNAAWSNIYDLDLE